MFYIDGIYCDIFDGSCYDLFYEDKNKYRSVYLYINVFLVSFYSVCLYKVVWFINDRLLWNVFS